MIKGATISECGIYRYSLTRIWDDNKPMVLWIMLNPSTADHTKDDATIKKIIKFSNKFGYGGLYVGNIFPFRSKERDVLKAFYKQGGLKAMGSTLENVIQIAKMISHSGGIIIAWGADARKIDNKRVDHIIKLINSFEPHCLKKTKAGEPWHPLYVADNTKLIRY